MTETISQSHGPDIEIQSHNSLIVLSDLNDRHQIIIDKENIPQLIAVLNRVVGEVVNEEVNIDLNIVAINYFTKDKNNQ